MHVDSLIELLDAAVLTRHVSGPYTERGGIQMVAPPGNFKTTIIDCAVGHHMDALVLSDLNVQAWNKYRTDFVSRRYTCLAFPEYEKIYERHKNSASNLEGTLKALVCEGFGSGANSDQRMAQVRATSLVIGGITSDCFERHFDRWQKNGFLRRFLWIVFALEDQMLIVEAIRNWQKIEFGKIHYRPANGEIKMALSDQTSRIIEKLMKEQPGLTGTGYVLMKKIVAVLEWKYGQNNIRVREILDDIAPAFSRDGATLVLPRKLTS